MHFPQGDSSKLYRQIAGRDQVEVGPLSRGVTFKPLSGPLQPGVRFLHHPLPAFPSAFLAIGLPTQFCGREYGLTQFHAQRERLGPAFPPVALVSTCPNSGVRHPATYPFWFGRVSLQPPGFDNDVYQQFTCVDPTAQPSLFVRLQRTNAFVLLARHEYLQEMRHCQGASHATVAGHALPVGYG